MMNKLITTIAILAAAITISSCAASPAINTTGEMPTSMADSATTASAGESSSSTAEYIKISASEAKTLMDAGNVTILDVRSQEEFDAGHIAGAIRLAYGEFPDKLAAVLPDKEAVILVYCRSGHRSKIASDMLIEAGYTHVMDFGGIIDWPYEVVTAD